MTVCVCKMQRFYCENGIAYNDTVCVQNAEILL